MTPRARPDSPAYRVAATTPVLDGPVLRVRRDAVLMPNGAVAARDVVAHPGAVGVLALDERDRVVLIRQYRHPVGRELWEIPAGLLDVPGESAWQAARRELVEEAGLDAGSWQVLLDALTSPGMSDEAIRIYLAQDLRDVERAPGVDEEAGLLIERVPLEAAVARVLAGEIENAMACLAILALAAARSGGLPLRAVESGWPARADRAPAEQGSRP